MLLASASFLALVLHAPLTVQDPQLGQEPDSGPEVSARLISSVSTVAPGCELELGVLLEIPAGWHIYWQNPGETGVATSARLAAPPGFDVEGPLFPGPIRHEDAGGIVSYVHEDEVLLFFRLRAPAELKEPKLAFSAKVRWLVCKDVCFVGAAEPELELPVANEPAPADDGTLKVFEAQRRLLPRPWTELAPAPAIEWVAVPVPAGERERFNCRLELAGAEAATFFPDPRSKLELARQSLETSGAWKRLALELVRPEDAEPEPPSAQGVLRLEKGSQVTYFRLDLRQDPQPLPRK
jgi:thiol:disulfide interchange protein DsbD